ncbi:MAG: hypothetical protein LBV40_01930 [Methanomicrobiales archaeon]|nr:hypothetical protein [Methanomicrobiales archaeon]
MMAALEFATDEVITEKTEGKKNKHKQTTNESRTINKFSKRYSELLSNPDKDGRMTLFEEFIADIAKRPVEVKKNRKNERKEPRKVKFCDIYKSFLR